MSFALGVVKEHNFSMVSLQKSCYSTNRSRFGLPLNVYVIVFARHIGPLLSVIICVCVKNIGQKLVDHVIMKTAFFLHRSSSSSSSLFFPLNT